MVKQFFIGLWEKINDLVGKFDLDGRLIGLYNDYVAPIKEVFKWLLLIFLVVIIILGLISFIKKSIKTFIVLSILAIVIIWLTKI